MSSSRDKKTLTLQDLKPGDIIFVSLPMGGSVPHPGIYSPVPGEVGNFIHMGYGIKRSGSIKSTLEQLLQQNTTIRVIRSRRFEGAAIAAQAEYWLRQDVAYDEVRLANSLYHFNFPGAPPPSSQLIIFEYLKFAARRETMPVKSVRSHTYSNIITLMGIGLLLPPLNRRVPLGKIGARLVQYGTSHSERPKGLTCAGFVLACIAAVALKDEIKPVSAETGWVSLKYSRQPPEHASQAYKTAFYEVQKEIGAHDYDGPSLHDLFTEAQLRHFSLERLTEKLTPLITSLNPHQPSAKDFFEGLEKSDDWENLGILDASELALASAPNRQLYRKEFLSRSLESQANRQHFKQQFGAGIFYRRSKKLDNQRSHSSAETTLAASLAPSSFPVCTDDMCYLEPPTVQTEFFSPPAVFDPTAISSSSIELAMQEEIDNLDVCSADYDLSELFTPELFQAMQVAAEKGLMMGLLLTLSDECITAYLTQHDYAPEKIRLAKQALRSLTVITMGASLSMTMGVFAAQQCLLFFGISQAHLNLGTMVTLLSMGLLLNPMGIGAAALIIAAGMGSSLLSSTATHKSSQFLQNSFFASKAIGLKPAVETQKENTYFDRQLKRIG